MARTPITIVMLTLNEEKHLPEVLKNVSSWAETIYIVDSLSTDRTVEIAREYGVNLVQRPFTNFGDQWNWAISHLPIKTPWTLKLDPDERLTEELKSGIEQVIENTKPCEGYSFPRQLWFMGKPLHVKQDVLRLWKTGTCHFTETIVNEQPIVSGRLGRLGGCLNHLDSPDLHRWYDKQNRYSTMEAIMRYQGRDVAVEPRLFGGALERRMFVKKWIWKVPLRYHVLFLYHLLGKGAWKDGEVGWIWARLRTEVYRMRELKFLEMKQRGYAPQIPIADHGDFDSEILSTPLQNELSS